MTEDADLTRLAEALTAALAIGPGVVARPGQLRVRLESALGASDAHRLRREVHQLLVGAEEHLPTNLTRLAPPTADTVGRLAADLAADRGWSADTARRTVQLWARALGFGHSTSTPTDPAPAPRHPREDR